MKPPIEPQSVIHFTVARTRKSAWVRAAKPGKLVEWIVRNLDSAATNNQEPVGKTTDNNSSKPSLTL